MSKPTEGLDAATILRAFDGHVSRRGALTGALAGSASLALGAEEAVAAGVRNDPIGAMPVTTTPVFAQGAIWLFVAGDHSGLADGRDVVASETVPLSKGAWTRLTDQVIPSRRSGANAVATRLSDQTDALPYRPEEFGAIGDGVQDDAPAIQRALNAITAASQAHKDGKTRPGVVMLTQGKRYRCGSRIVMDRRFHTLLGYATLDFSGWPGVCLQVSGSQTEFGNANGQNGAIEGQIVIVGPGSDGDGKSIGILYDTPVGASSTSVRTVGVTVCRCSIAFQIGARGYNQDFINCKAFDCDVIFDWPGEPQDSDERITVFGGTFYNSRLFLRHHRGAGAFYAFSCSVDYTQQIAELSGKAEFFGVHLESNRWTDRPVRISGNGGMFLMHGGWILVMDNKNGAMHFFDVGAGCAAKLRDVLTHNANVLRTPDERTPTTWATGEGRFEVQGLEPAFEFGGFPARLHDRHSVLADPSFDEPDVQLNPIWRIADVNPIRSRDGNDAPMKGESAHSLTFARATSGQMEGTGCLRVNKGQATGRPAAMVIVAIPVRYGDKAKGGLRVRTAPDRPGTDRRVMLRGGFAILDGTDQHNIPILRKFATPGDLVLTPPTSGYVLAAPGNGASDFAAPTWATHYVIVLDLVHADQASFLIDGRWADRW